MGESKEQDAGPILRTTGIECDYYFGLANFPCSSKKNMGTNKAIKEGDDARAAKCFPSSMLNKQMLTVTWIIFSYTH